MELLFNHQYGKQEHQDLVICNPMAVVSDAEETAAVNTGWLALDHVVRGRETWYQSRSTRVQLSHYKPRFHQHCYNGQPIDFKIIEASEMVKLLGLPRIYREYMRTKKFTANYDPFANFNARDQFMLFYQHTADNIIAFTKQKKYGDGDGQGFDNSRVFAYESVLHACGQMPISQLTLDIELCWAKKSGADYYLLGSGYEKSSEYKSNYAGFEWWTGTEWSTSRSQYRKLCRRDSRLTKISELMFNETVNDAK